MKLKLNVHADVNTAKILRERGLGASMKASKFLASTVRRFCAPYVPRQQGPLNDTSRIVETIGAAAIEYNQPYAHYQYYGEVMAGPAPKHYTGVPLTYNGAPMRGKEWEKRMMADRGRDVVRALAVYVGGRIK